MMHPKRSALKKVLVGAVAVSALGIGGYVASGDGSAQHAAPRPHAVQKKLSLADALAIASRTPAVSPNVVGAGIHMRYSGVTTGSAADHSTDVTMLAASVGMDRAVSTQAGGGRTIGKLNLHDITLTRQTDQYSVKLLTQAMKGTSSPVVSIFFSDGSGPGGTLNDYLRIDLANVIVTKFNQNAGSDERPVEELSLNFTKITFTTRIPSTTTQTVTYDIVQGKVI